MGAFASPSQLLLVVSSKPCCRYELKNMSQDGLKLAFEICQIDTYQFTSIKLQFDVSYVCLETAGTCWRM